MIYLFIFSFITLYLYSVEKYFSKKFSKQFIFWLPAFIIFTIFPSLQYDVGTDYQTYFQYFFNNDHVLYLKKNEFIYYYLVEFSKIFGDPQFQFIIVSIIQSLLFFYLLFLLKLEGYKSWLIFLIYFLCTGIYHNQMNGLRQYICIYAVPVIAIHLYRKNNIKFFSYTLISFFIHSSSIISSGFLFLLSKLKININRKLLFLIFFVSLFIYMIDFKSLILTIFEFFDLRFLSYMDTNYTEGRDFSKLLTRFYYLPVIMIFWYLLFKDKDYNNKSLNSFFILIFSLTHFMFLQSLSFDLMLRAWLYFNFFIIFPIYYVFIRLNRISFFLLFVYLIVFYISKVLLFPVAEYEYHIYRGWF